MELLPVFVLLFPGQGSMVRDLPAMTSIWACKASSYYFIHWDSGYRIDVVPELMTDSELGTHDRNEAE